MISTMKIIIIIVEYVIIIYPPLFLYEPWKQLLSGYSIVEEIGEDE